MNIKNIIKEKGVKGILVYIAIFIVLILILIVLIKNVIEYIDTHKSKKNDNGVIPTIVEPIDEVDIEATAKKLFEMYRYDEHYIAFGDFSDNRAKLLLAYRLLSNEKGNTFEIECSKVGAIINKVYCGPYYDDGNFYKLTDEEKIQYVNKNFSTEAIKSKDMENKIKELFGSDYTYSPEDFGLLKYSSTSGFIHYDKNNDVYAKYTIITGLVYGDYFKEEIESNYIEEDKLYIKSKIVESNWSEIYDYDIVGNTITYEFKKDVKTSKYVFFKISKDFDLRKK